jgi:hypothetical protein
MNLALGSITNLKLASLSDPLYCEVRIEEFVRKDTEREAAQK